MGSLASGVLETALVHLPAPVDNIYTNWKGMHFVYVQVMCDACYQVTHVLTNYPGSSHGSVMVFQRDSNLKRWLFRDNSYSLKTWLITQYIMPTTVREITFTQKHAKDKL